MISLNEPNINKKDIQSVVKTLKDNWVSSSGPEVSKLENKICKFTSAKNAVAFVNATSALFMALKLIGANRNTEIIVPTVTFVAPVNAILYNSASPIFMDVDKYFNIDVDKTIEFLNKQTIFKNGYTINKKTGRKILAIIVVHVWGNAVFLDNIKKICKKKNIKLIEDASESLGTKYITGTYKKRFTGTVGDIGVYSFNGNKIITGGNGGILVTNNLKIAKKAKYLSCQAIDDNEYYIHKNIGYNFRLSSINAALCISQLNKINDFIRKKKKIYKAYKKKLLNNSNYELVEPPFYSDNNHWMNVIIIKDGKLKKLINKMKKSNIQARAMWLPNHLQKPYKNYQKYNISMANYFKEKALCIPSSSNLTQKNINKILSVLKK